MQVEEIIALMAKEGLRVTDQRRTLANIFVEHEGYLTPKEVYDQMEQRYRGLSFDTVYRNLRLLQEMEVLEQFVFEDGIKFRVRCSDMQHHHHHLICVDCEKTIPLAYCPLDHIVADVREDFQVVRHKFEIFRYCKDCQEA